MMTDARAEILDRFRKALGSEDVPAAGVERSYIRTGSLNAGERLALFLDRLRDLGVAPECCGPRDLTRQIEDRLRSRVHVRLAVDEMLPSAWLPAGFEFVPGGALSHADLDGCDGAVTTCAAAVAASGTILLDGVPGQGRRALSLLPGYHLCMVEERQIRATLPEAMLLIHPSCKRPMTLITGPSGTSDIEMTRIQGVHGPRTLDVIVVRA